MNATIDAKFAEYDKKLIDLDQRMRDVDVLMEVFNGYLDVQIDEVRKEFANMKSLLPYIESFINKNIMNFEKLDTVKVEFRKYRDKKEKRLT